MAGCEVNVPHVLGYCMALPGDVPGIFPWFVPNSVLCFVPNSVPNPVHGGCRVYALARLRKRYTKECAGPDAGELKMRVPPPARALTERRPDDYNGPYVTAVFGRIPGLAVFARPGCPAALSAYWSI